jgi:hypothetical protein
VRERAVGTKLRLRAGALAATVCIAGFGVACGPSRVTECNEVTGVVNGALKKLEDSSAKADADKAEKVAYLRSMASTMDGVASDLAKAKTSIAPLKDLSTKYQKLAKDVAEAARQLSEAVDQNDLDKDAKARDRLEKLADQEGPLVNSINDFCKGG